MATTTTPLSVISLDEAGAAAAANGFGMGGPPDPDTGRRGRVYVRRDAGIESFGVNAFYQADGGAFVIGKHDELGPAGSRHEELYVVVAGDCTFTVGGEEALEPLAEALAAWPAYKELATNDEDFAPLRDDPRFEALVS